MLKPAAQAPTFKGSHDVGIFFDPQVLTVTPSTGLLQEDANCLRDSMMLFPGLKTR